MIATNLSSSSLLHNAVCVISHGGGIANITIILRNTTWQE